MAGYQIFRLSISSLICAGLLAACSEAPPEPEPEEDQGSLLDLFIEKDDPNTTIRVNRYLWNASLEVLDFLPLETVDPFSGVIVTDWGIAPGGTKEYKATILIRDPALDARSLKLNLLTRGGPADLATVEAIENAIFTRARQLRQRDGAL